MLLWRKLVCSFLVWSQLLLGLKQLRKVHGVADVMLMIQQLFRFVHLADNSAQIPVGQPGHNCCCCFFNVGRFLDCYSSSVYETKPAWTGVKVYSLMQRLGSRHSRYILAGLLKIDMCNKVILDLLSGLEVSGLHLYTDTSPTLYLHLCNRCINACGTSHPNRVGFPKELVTTATRHNHGFMVSPQWPQSGLTRGAFTCSL